MYSVTTSTRRLLIDPKSRTSAYDPRWVVGPESATKVHFVRSTENEMCFKCEQKNCAVGSKSGGRPHICPERMKRAIEMRTAGYNINVIMCETQIAKSTLYEIFNKNHDLIQRG